MIVHPSLVHIERQRPQHTLRAEASAFFFPYPFVPPSLRDGKDLYARYKSLEA
ncbi:hypothetical protein HMPREF1556_00207 [Porphyromonas sp. oral taxon 278 str. W7784]|nr:hypothetical protein HMPREF1556_00207 [Porphyromonas sp. oral taxon 278 str. W7784]